MNNENNTLTKTQTNQEISVANQDLNNTTINTKKSFKKLSLYDRLLLGAISPHDLNTLSALKLTTKLKSRRAYVEYVANYYANIALDNPNNTETQINDMLESLIAMNQSFKYPSKLTSTSNQNQQQEGEVEVDTELDQNNYQTPTPQPSFVNSTTGQDDEEEENQQDKNNYLVKILEAGSFIGSLLGVNDFLNNNCNNDQYNLNNPNNTVQNLTLSIITKNTLQNNQQDLDADLLVEGQQITHQ